MNAPIRQTLRTQRVDGWPYTVQRVTYADGVVRYEIICPDGQPFDAGYDFCTPPTAAEIVDVAYLFWRESDPSYLEQAVFGYERGGNDQAGVLDWFGGQ